VPAFAELRNLVALATAAVLMREHLAEQKGGAAPDEAGNEAQASAAGQAAGARTLFAHFLSEERCGIARFEVPRQAPSLAVVRQINNRHWLFAVSGGVEIDPEALAGPKLHAVDSSGKLERAGQELGLSPDATRWWWD